MHSTPDFIIRAAIELAIEGYRREKQIPPIPGKLWAEKPEWLGRFDELIRCDDRNELSRLALLAADGQETVVANVRRAFGVGVGSQELHDAYNTVAGVPDANRPNAGLAITQFFVQSAIDIMNTNDLSEKKKPD